MDLYTAQRCAAGFSWTANLLERNARIGRFDRAQPEGEFARGARWRVGLFLVCVVDDLEVVEITRRGLCESLQQHDCQRKVAAREYAAPVFARQPVDLRVVIVDHARGADDDMRACRERSADVRLRGIWFGEFNEHIAGRRERLR